MYMAPDNYRFIVKKFKEINDKVAPYFKDSPGNIIPMYFKEEIEDLKREISKELGICNMGKQSLKSARRKIAYQNMEDELNDCLNKLTDLY